MLQEKLQFPGCPPSGNYQGSPWAGDSFFSFSARSFASTSWAHRSPWWLKGSFITEPHIVSTPKPLRWSTVACGDILQNSLWEQMLLLSSQKGWVWKSIILCMANLKNRFFNYNLQAIFFQPFFNFVHTKGELWAKYSNILCKCYKFLRLNITYDIN